MKDVMDKLREFHEVYNSHLQNTPGLPSEKIRELRRALIKEEFEEFLEAEEQDDLIGIADALADLVYVIAGTAISYGVPLAEVFDEVHRSNMSKLDSNGNPIFREDGKVMKGPNYFKPDVAGILYGTKR